MNNLVLASSTAEAVALDETNSRLSEAGGLLSVLAENVLVAASKPRGDDRAQAEYAKLADFARQELVPLAAAIKSALAGVKGADLVVSTLAADHHARLVAAVTSLERQEDPVHLVYQSARLQEAGSVFLDQSRELMVPVLAQNPAITLAGILPECTFEMDVAAAVVDGGPTAPPETANFDTRHIQHAVRA
ncbi:MAG: hypothetical protein WBX27_02690 [Specibacter sp.]